MDNADILGEIFGWIDRGSTYKAVLFTCRLFRDVAAAVHPTADEKFANHLATLVKLYPNADWSMTNIATNPSLTRDIIKAFSIERLTSGWDISCNDALTWDDVLAIPEYPWSYANLSQNPNITWDIVQANPDKPWDYAGLSHNPSITWDIIRANPDKPWVYTAKYPIPRDIFDTAHDKIEYRHASYGVTWDIVQAYPDKPWDWYYLSVNHSITWDIIASNPDKPWNYDGISQNPNITADIFNANLDKDWNYTYLSGNPSINVSMITDHPHLPWDFSAMSANPAIPIEFILTTNYGWDFCDVSCRSDITWDIVRAHPDIQWIIWSWAGVDRGLLYYEPEIDISINGTWEEIQKIDPPRRDLLSAVMYNRNITWDIILNNAAQFEDIREHYWGLTWKMVHSTPDYPWRW